MSYDGALLWQQRVVQDGTVLFGGPIVADGMVYLESAPSSSPGSLASFLFALDTRHGTLRWKQRLDTLPDQQVSRCVLGNGLLYTFIAGSPISTLEAFNPAHGSLVWKHYLKETFFSNDLTAGP